MSALVYLLAGAWVVICVVGFYVAVDDVRAFARFRDPLGAVGSAAMAVVALCAGVLTVWLMFGGRLTG